MPNPYPKKLNKLTVAAILAVVGAFMNAVVRGGLIKNVWPGARGLKVANVVGFAGASYWVSGHNWRFAAAMGLAMYVGQSFALFAKESDEAFSARKFARWAWVVFKRGIAWAAPIAAVMAYFYRLDALYYAPLPFLMPICYSTVWYMRPVNRWIHPWSVAEASMCLALWVPLVAIY